MNNAIINLSAIGAATCALLGLQTVLDEHEKMQHFTEKAGVCYEAKPEVPAPCPSLNAFEPNFGPGPCSSLEQTVGREKYPPNDRKQKDAKTSSKGQKGKTGPLWFPCHQGYTQRCRNYHLFHRWIKHKDIKKTYYENYVPSGEPCDETKL